MKTGIFNSIVKLESLTAILVILTMILVVARQTLHRELTVDPQNANWSTHTSDDRVQGGASFTEDLSSSDGLSFSYTTQENDQNSYAVFLATPPNEDRPLDLDWFTEITIRARAEGKDKQQFLFHIRDCPEHLACEEDAVASKYNEVFIELTEQTQSISLTRDCFTVPRWWITDYAVLPQDASPSFSNIDWVEIAVFNPNKTSNGVVVIEEIKIRGPLITSANFYQLLSGLWSLLSIPLIIRFYADTKKARAIRRIRLNQVAQQGSSSKASPSYATPDQSNSDTIEVQRLDELTGLLSNFGMQDAIDEALQAVRAGDAKANIVLIDVDDMELLNRSSGMQAGNAMLREIGEIIKVNIPENHTVGRWSDDKFLVVCLGKGRDESRELACNLRKCIDESTTATCSFGVQQLNPINSFEEAYERASKCIQEAKFNGKNKVVLFNLRSTIVPLISNEAAQVSQSSPANLV